MTKETPRSNPGKKIVKKLRNATLITALGATLLTGANSCEGGSSLGYPPPINFNEIEKHSASKLVDTITEEEKVEYEQLDKRLDYLGKKASRYLANYETIDNMAMLSAKYCIPIVYPNFYKGTVLCLDIIDCRNDNQKNTKIISYSNSHTVRPVLYKNDNNEEFKLSPEEYKKALDEVEKILDKEEEIIDNHLNDIINGL